MSSKAAPRQQLQICRRAQLTSQRRDRIWERRRNRTVDATSTSGATRHLAPTCTHTCHSDVHRVCSRFCTPSQRRHPLMAGGTTKTTGTFARPRSCVSGWRATTPASIRSVALCGERVCVPLSPAHCNGISLLTRFPAGESSTRRAAEPAVQRQLHQPAIRPGLLGATPLHPPLPHQHRLHPRVRARRACRSESCLDRAPNEHREQMAVCCCRTSPADTAGQALPGPALADNAFPLFINQMNDECWCRSTVFRRIHKPCAVITGLAAAIVAYNLWAPAAWLRLALAPTAHTLLGTCSSAASSADLERRKTSTKPGISAAVGTYSERTDSVQVPPSVWCWSSGPMPAMPASRSAILGFTTFVHHTHSRHPILCSIPCGTSRPDHRL